MKSGLIPGGLVPGFRDYDEQENIVRYPQSATCDPLCQRIFTYPIYGNPQTSKNCFVMVYAEIEGVQQRVSVGKVLLLFTLHVCCEGCGKDFSILHLRDF